MSLLDFTGKTVLVPGGGVGIGRGIVDAFAAAGANLFVAEIDAERAAAVQAYHEWLPTRLPDPALPLQIYRSFDIGTLASLHRRFSNVLGRVQS